LPCKELDISVRTYERWVSKGGIKEDGRPLAFRPEPKNKLTKEEKEEILGVVKKRRVC
jgi:putative transposase